MSSPEQESPNPASEPKPPEPNPERKADLPQDLSWDQFSQFDPYNPKNPANIKKALDQEAASLSAQAAEQPQENEAPFERADLLEAQEVMAADFFGPQEVKKAFEVDLTEDEVPELPFSRSELEHFKSEGFFLSLRIEHDKEGNPLTIKQMKALYQTDPQNPNQRIFYQQDWYEKPENNDPFYDRQTPKPQWALTKKEILPDSTSKNHQAQETLLQEYAQSQAQHLEPNHRIQRREAVDIVYDEILTFRSKGIRLLPDKYDWSKTQLTQGAYRGRFAGLGPFDSTGFLVHALRPDDASGTFGVCPSAVS